jgi:hypothetical protein
MATEHGWRTVVTDGRVTFATCSKCGLSRLTTMNGQYYFIRWDRQFAQCSSPYRLEATE